MLIANYVNSALAQMKKVETFSPTELEARKAIVRYLYLEDCKRNGLGEKLPTEEECMHFCQQVAELPITTRRMGYMFDIVRAQIDTERLYGNRHDFRMNVHDFEYQLNKCIGQCRLDSWKKERYSMLPKPDEVELIRLPQVKALLIELKQQAPCITHNPTTAIKKA